ncbi:Aim29 protein [Starmerella bacillaris]|uniref:Aim29 protein n=1 Tax=Starmerella bacillaris TaxID=1247836 RepID=A0AAV5RKQ1_STABA|nr:Aim29 protein [Starmerella bacillaris]
MSEELTSSHDPHHATITVRLVRSLEYRTIRNHVFRNIDLTEWTPAILIEECKALVAVDSSFKPYRTVDFNAAKIYTHAHFTKTQNLAINLDKDEEWVLTTPERMNKPLSELGIMNESEISVYNNACYAQFKQNPVQKWDN